MNGELEAAILRAVQADLDRVIAGTTAGVFVPGKPDVMWLSWLEQDVHGTITPAGAWTRIARIGRVIDRHTWRTR